METLGHSQISLTLDTYSHILPALQQEAADRMDAVLGLGGQRKTGHWPTSQNRPFRRASETGEFYFVPSSVRKSVCTFVRQLRGPHLSTCA
jgi:hypothetical protein